MATPTKKLVNGQLVETELQAGTSPLTPAPVAPPVSPAGVAAAGGSVDEAKMAGTPNAKQGIANQTAKPLDTLSGQQRQTAAPAQPADQQATQKAARLKQLGTLGTRVEGLIAQRIAGMQSQQAQMTVNEDAIKQRLGTQQTGSTKVTDAQTALQAYLTKKAAGQDTSEELRAVATVMGQENLDAGGLEGLFTGPDAAIAAAAGAPQAKVTVGELDLSQAGIDPAQLAADLGVDETALAAMSPDELQQAVQDASNREFSQVDSLKSEYMSAAPARRQQIMQQLRSLGESGTAAIETAVADLDAVLQAQEEVSFGGQTYNVQDLLKSDEISNKILGALRTPSEMAALKADPNSAGLATWIEQNQASLGALADNMGTDVADFTQTQEDFKKTTEGLDPAVLEALGIDATGYQTAASAGTVGAALDANAVVAAMRDNEGLRAMINGDPTLAAKFGAAPDALALASENPEFLGLLKTNPELLDQVAGMSKGDLSDSLRAAQAVANDPNNDILMAFTGQDGKSMLLLDPAARANVLATVKQLNKMRKDPRSAALLTDANFISLVQSKTIDTPAELAYVTKHPKVIGQMAQHAKNVAAAKPLLKALGNAKTVEDTVKSLFGKKDPFSVLGDFEAAEKYLKIGTNAAGKKAAKDYMARMVSVMDLDGDGRVTAKDLPQANGLAYGSDGYLGEGGTKKGAAAQKAAQDKWMKDVQARLAARVGADVDDNAQLTGKTPPKGIAGDVAYWGKGGNAAKDFGIWRPEYSSDYSNKKSGEKAAADAAAAAAAAQAEKDKAYEAALAASRAAEAERVKQAKAASEAAKATATDGLGKALALDISPQKDPSGSNRKALIKNMQDYKKKYGSLPPDVVKSLQDRGLAKEVGV
jgi:hypothetical protein